MSPARVLILGGTAEARELASELIAAGRPVISSLAGRVAHPRLPVGEVRVGGFGGPEALARWLHDHGIVAVVDATHPFAERISSSAAAACPRACVPLLRLARPGWTERRGDHWYWVESLEAAAAAIPGRGTRVLLTTGRQGLSAFALSHAPWFLIRCVDPPDAPLPPHHELILDRGPYTLPGELALIDHHHIDLVITKDSGGNYTQAKLDAARARGLPVIIIHRPPRPPGQTLATVESVVEWVLERT